ncbi:MAG TPA: hypothetical protein EYP07_09290 [Kiloniellaceae bacterium]|nr:hypothetical protein [Kiloniellaceae bacterium]
MAFGEQRVEPGLVGRVPEVHAQFLVQAAVETRLLSDQKLSPMGERPASSRATRGGGSTPRRPQA